jgi:hypothetical protein
MADKKVKTVRVKLLQGAAGPMWAGSPGDVVWLPEEAAQQFVEGGWGELVENEPGADAVDPQAEGVVEVTGPDSNSGPMVPASAAEELAVATTAERAERAVAARKRPAEGARGQGPGARGKTPAGKEPEAKKAEAKKEPEKPEAKKPE